MHLVLTVLREDFVQSDAVRMALAFVPVLLFLVALRALDSYKLVASRMVFLSLAAGAAAAGVSLLINTFFFQHFALHEEMYARWAAPMVEEAAKAAYWVALIAAARVAFMADSAICAFATGAGFALVENLVYLHVLQEQGLGIWVMRGFGTAIMHGGATALGAAISAYLNERMQRRRAMVFAPGLLAAVALHSMFNQSLRFPVASMVAAVAGLPLILGVVFYLSERSLRRWLGGKMDRDIDLLQMIQSNEFPATRVGTYLASLQEAFPPELRGDMLSLLHLTAHLSVRAKGDLMLREAGLKPEPAPEMEEMFAELRYLEKSIGPTGMMAIRPLLSRSPRDLWEMHQLRL